MHYLFFSVFNPRVTKKLEWIFIVGVGHTGSSILCRKFANVRECYSCQHETEMFLGSRFRVYLFKLVLSGIAIKYNKSFVIEKTPLHWRCSDVIFDNFPNAQIIVTYRDPLETSASQIARFDNGHVMIDVMSEFVALQFQMLSWKIRNINYSVLGINEHNCFLDKFMSINNLSAIEQSEPFTPNILESLLFKLGFEYYVTPHEKERFNQIKTVDFKPVRRRIGSKHLTLGRSLLEFENSIKKFVKNWTQ